MSLSRSRARLLAGETLDILNDGFYMSPSGRRIPVRAVVQNAVQNTTHYRESEVPTLPSFEPRPTVVEVRNETTFTAAKRLEATGLRTLALNFASAKSIGGGWKNVYVVVRVYLVVWKRTSIFTSSIVSEGADSTPIG